VALRGVIESLSTGTYEVRRTVAGTYDLNGRYTTGAPTTIQITASVQPDSGRTLQDLPEGQRGDEIRKIHTRTELVTRAPGREPDLVTIDGETWYCIRVQRWQAFGDVHWKAYVARQAKP
jgi:hypothetical protein